MKLAIMQGRLVPREGGHFQSFPRLRWRDEFALAAAAGLDAIEWIYDSYGESVNPLSSSEGRDEMRRLSDSTGVGVESVCADWFMDFPLTLPDAAEAELRWARLGWLLNTCAPLGITRIVVPFVDASKINDEEEAARVAERLNSLVPLMEQTRVELHLETSLGPADFSVLLAQVQHDCVKVNYDSGNSASLGFKPEEEFAAYGARVGSVHLKDRLLGASTVPLGSGHTDFDSLFDCLAEAGYRADFVLQVARGAEGDELDWARGNVRVARQMIGRLKTGTRPGRMYEQK